MKGKNIPCCDWEEPKTQRDKFAGGEGSNMADGLSANVPMRNEDWPDSDQYRGFGPAPYRKTEKPVR